jgi:ABC-type sulfate/molybdate transport systems ATPase subunit
VDEDTREEMYRLLKTVQNHSGATVLHVTHSRREARALADTLLELSDGTVREMTLR